MNAVATADSPKVEKVSQAIAWFPIAAFALVWLEVIWRLQFEWSVNPQTATLAFRFWPPTRFWRRWQTRRSLPAPGAALFWVALIFWPRRFGPGPSQSEANPDWRLLIWAMAGCAAVISAAGFCLAAACVGAAFRFPILLFCRGPVGRPISNRCSSRLMRADALSTSSSSPRSDSGRSDGQRQSKFGSGWSASTKRAPHPLVAGDVMCSIFLENFIGSPSCGA